MDESTSQLELPGFRFHPTEEELLDFYLKKMALGKNMRFDIIGFLNIYRHDPWDLPGLAKIGEREWYFFVPRDRKHGSGGRPNRTTENGFWKATGSDRKIFSLSDPKRQLGLKKTLVFYKGRAPRGSKTDWVMSEYRLLDSCTLPKDIVLCKIYRKATSLKVLEQRAAMEELQTNTIHHANSTPSSPITPPMDTMSFSSHNYDDFLPVPPMSEGHVALNNKEDQDLLVIVEEKLKDEVKEESDIGTVNSSSSSLKLPGGMENLGGGLQLQLPKFNMDWTQDSFWTQLRSPWLDNFTLTPYANILNF